MVEKLDNDNPTRAEIRKYIIECNETDDRKTFLSKIDSITDGKNVHLSKEYLSEKLGGIPWQKLPPENFFNAVDLCDSRTGSSTTPSTVCYAAGPCSVNRHSSTRRSERHTASSSARTAACVS